MKTENGKLKKYKLGEILDFFNGKQRPKNIGKYPLYGGNGIIDYVDEYNYDDNIIIGRVGANCGCVQICNEKCWVSDNAISVKVKSDFDKQYIFQLLKTLNLNTKHVGAAQPLITQNILSELVVRIPSLESQQKIAGVLSSLDDKIALNRRMNAKLEQMAKRLYDHWFVQFDFPFDFACFDYAQQPKHTNLLVAERSRGYKSSGGKMVWNETLKREIPAGWKVKKLGDVCEIFNGSTPSTADNDNYGGNIIWITPKDLSEQKSKFVYHGTRNITQKGYNSCSTTFVPKGTVVMSSRAPIGLLSIAMCELCTNQGFKNLVPKNSDYTNLLYYTLLTHIPQIQNLGTGTTFKEVSKEKLSNFSVLYPTDNFIKMFTEKTISIFNYQLSIEKETAKLTALRDRLLPLLMNGQVEVR